MKIKHKLMDHRVRLMRVDDYFAVHYFSDQTRTVLVAVKSEMAIICYSDHITEVISI